MKRHLTLRTTLLAMAGFGLLACGSTTDAVRYDKASERGDNRTVVELEEHVTKACNIATDTAFFTYNGTELDEVDKTTLQTIGHCMQKGELDDESIVVMGYTDPTGTDAYNKALGMSRSQMVAKYLVDHCGVDKKRIYVKSFGEEHAKSGNTSDYAVDRRVEIRVAEKD